MSFFQALEVEEKKDGQGWSHSNMFPADAPSSTTEENMDIWPSSENPQRMEVRESVSAAAISVAQETQGVVQETLGVVQQTQGVVQETQSVVQLTPSAVQPTPNVQLTPSLVQPTPCVVQATPIVVQATPTMAQTTPTVMQTTPTVLQPAPNAVQPTPYVVKPTPDSVFKETLKPSVTGNLGQQTVSGTQKNKTSFKFLITSDGRLLTETGQNIPLTPEVKQAIQKSRPTTFVSANNTALVPTPTLQSPTKLNGSAVVNSGGQKLIGISPNILRTSVQNVTPTVVPSVVITPQISNHVMKTSVINSTTGNVNVNSNIPSLAPQQKQQILNITSQAQTPIIPVVNPQTRQTFQGTTGHKIFILRSGPGAQPRANIINQPQILPLDTQNLQNVVGKRPRLIRNPKSHVKKTSYYTQESKLIQSPEPQISNETTRIVSKNEKVQNIQVVYPASLLPTPSQTLPVVTSTQSTIQHSLPKSITVGTLSQSNKDLAPTQTLVLQTGDIVEENRPSYNDLTRSSNQIFQKYVGSISPTQTKKKSPPSKLHTLIKAPCQSTPVISMQASSTESLLAKSLTSEPVLSTPENIPQKQEGNTAVALETTVSAVTVSPGTITPATISPTTITVTPSNSQSPAESQSLVATVLCSYNDPTIDASQLQNLSQLSQLTQSTGVISSQNSTVSIESHSESENSNSASDVESSESMLKDVNLDQVEILHNLQLKKNMVFSIPMKGKDYYFIYDGKNFQPYNFIPETKVVTPGLNSSDSGSLQIKPVILGGGLENKKLKGNATGMNMIQQNKSESVRELLMKTKTTTTRVIPISHASGSGLVNVQNGRVWKHSSGPQANLTRKPIHALIPVKKEPSVEIIGMDTPNHSESKNLTEESAASKTPQKRQATEELEEEHIVHCRYCGYSSGNIKECDRCGRIFARNVKVTTVKRKKVTEVKNSDKDAAISKQSFYGQKLNEQSAPYQKSDAMENYVKQKQGFGRPITVSGKTHRTPNTKLVKVKKIAPAEPVTVILSSDDEDDSSHSANQHQVPVSVPVSTATGTVVTISMAKVKKDISDELGDLVNVLPRSTSPVFPGSRIRRMEDEKGNLASKDGNKGKRSRPSSRAENPISTNLPENPIPSSVSSASADEKTEVPSTITFKVKSINIGSLKSIPIDPVMLSSEGIDMYIECEEDTFRISIPQEDIQQFCLCFEVQRLMLIHTTADYGKRLRLKLGMNEKIEGKPYFDPDDNDGRYQYIQIDSMMGIGSEELTSFLQQKYASDKRNPQTDFVYIMSEAECKNVLNQSQSSDAEQTSGDVTPAQSEMERSPSPPKFMFYGPVKKLLTFPPPPEKGGIQVTNEDRFCLQEGEFLNDVIIDFYLKYLYLKILSDEDRKRTHIFSSFFFKRLTLRQGRGSSANETPDMTPAEKKHARVRTWTKHVDLFEKDFIIVPINEHSHWFLAIICYPGMTGIRRHKYIPKNRPCPPIVNPILERKDGTKVVQAIVGKEKLSTTPTKEPLRSLRGYKIPKKEEQAAEPQKDHTESKRKAAGESKTQNVESKIENGKREEKDENETTEKSDESEKDMEVDDSDKSDEKSDEKKEPMETDDTEDKTSENKRLEVNETVSAIQANPIRNTGKEICGRPLTQEEEKHTPKVCLEGQKQPCILVLDSLAGQSRSRIINILKEYLQVEWDVKKKTPNILKEKMRGSCAKVPQQTNYSDCGVYVLQYVESFFDDPIQDFSIPLRPLSNWFTAEKVGKKRAEIDSIIMQLKEEQENPTDT